jgi:archaellum biogenesis protein FlaJ (TadC family)
MFKNYFLVSCLVIAFIMTLIAIILFVDLLTASKEEKLSESKEERREVFWNKAVLTIGIMIVVCLTVTYKIYQYLIFEVPGALEEFGIWYLFGFLSRMPLLYYKDYILHPVFATDWEEVFKTFFTALLGPLQILFTIWGIWKHKPWY